MGKERAEQFLGVLPPVFGPKITWFDQECYAELFGIVEVVCPGRSSAEGMGRALQRNGTQCARNTIPAAWAKVSLSKSFQKYMH